ncbi:AAA family ATPase [Desulfamplus magnetovallimortis]|nr:AAA family ATPase [Desulfamplus magnetovallimortis]
MKKRILYAEASYEAIIQENGYFVDKTQYIEKLERIKNPVFLRPRRFGKSLLCTMLEAYYDIRKKDDFHELFGHTWIGKKPTPLHSSCFVLHLDFSVIEVGDMATIEKSFNHVCNAQLDNLVFFNQQWFQDQITIDLDKSAVNNLQSILKTVKRDNLPPLFVIIDEYDNFANQLIVSHEDHLYHQLMSSKGFLKTFFKTLKEGRKSQTIRNVFITGVLPVTIDELASGFNIATIITLEPEFENMLGFTQAEVDRLLDEIYHDYEMDPDTRSETDALIKNQYNGYHFIHPNGEPVYNSTILIYFLHYFTRYRAYPEYLTDMNLKTDLEWVRRITGSNPDLTKGFVDQLMVHNTIEYDKNFLTAKFNMSQFFEKGFFPISFYYLGMLTRLDSFNLKLPNMNMRKIFAEYFNELHAIDVSTGYTNAMQQFLKDLDLSALFAAYWDRYISQLPEAIFQKVNENFYRTTFYELCSRYLSEWFTWNVERSYPKGRSDLEFVGKYNECFAGIRMVIEFKYLSNAEFKRLKTTIEDFTLQDEDTKQIAGYVDGLAVEYPEAKISQYVIYCIGNQGWRVFKINVAGI